MIQDNADILPMSTSSVVSISRECFDISSVFSLIIDRSALKDKSKWLSIPKKEHPVGESVMKNTN